jgi:hypothetical protein
MEKILDAILVLFGVILFATILIIWFDRSNNPNAYKYTIDVEGRSNYYTNHYICNSNCIKFKNGDKDTMTVCGSYSIKSNK